MPDTIDLEHLRTWIGNRESASDVITSALVTRFTATLDGHTQIGTEPGYEVPPGLHWCLALPATAHDDLGIDGHPAKGGFLPPVPLPRRMWASSDLRFHHPLRVGMDIERQSTIADVVYKQGTNAGPLVFVHVHHRYQQPTARGVELLIEEQQVIVYREHAPYRRPPIRPSKNPLAVCSALEITPDSKLLFRYSALTFNTHRIHYDLNYTTREEDYPGLVVHGPLMATLLMHLAQASRTGQTLCGFNFRGVAPAFVDHPLHLSLEDGKSSALEIRDHEEALIMTASAQFADRDEL